MEQAKANLEFAEAEANSAKMQIGLTPQTTTNGTGGASAQKESDSADYAARKRNSRNPPPRTLQSPKPTSPRSEPLTNARKAISSDTRRCSPPTTSRNINSTPWSHRPRRKKRSGSRRTAISRRSTKRRNFPRQFPIFASQVGQIAIATARNQSARTQGPSPKPPISQRWLPSTAPKAHSNRRN